MYEVDSTHVDHQDFDAVITKAVNAFLSHAEEEERDQLPKLINSVSAEENNVRCRAFPYRQKLTRWLQKMAVDFLKARKMAPTRPHPAAPQSGGMAQKVAGLQGSLHDKVVETLGGRKFVSLKYEHPDVSAM